MTHSDKKIPVTQLNPASKKTTKPKPKPNNPFGLSKKQAQWAWFIGLYLAGLVTILTIAKLIKWGMGI